MKKTALISAALFVLPLFAFAQSLNPIRNFIASVGNIAAMLVPILITLTIVVFFWGLVRYLWGGSEADHSAGRQLMIWGLVSLFVMVSIWGIVRLGQSAFGLEGKNTIQLPAVPVPGGNPNAGSSQNTGDSGYY